MPSEKKNVFFEILTVFLGGQGLSSQESIVALSGYCNYFIFILWCFSDLRSRIALEGDAISRAKEFLRRQRRSVQRRQVSLTK